MGTRTFMVAAVLVLVVGVVGRITYEQISTPALAQDEDPRVGQDCDDFRSQAEAQAALRQDPTDPGVLDEDEGPDDGIACEATVYEDPTTDLTPVAAAVGGGGSASPTSSASPTPTTTTSPSPSNASPSASASPKPRKKDNLFKSGGSSSGPVPLMPDGSCPVEFPVKQNGACYP